MQLNHEIMKSAGRNLALLGWSTIEGGSEKSIAEGPARKGRF